MKKTLYRVMHLCMLLNFITLVVTGVMRFTLPFSLAVTRLHIISGFIVTLLIGFHIFGRLKAMKNICSPRGKKSFSTYLPVIYSIVLSVLVWAGAWYAWPGAKQVVDLSYESRHRNEIFRNRPNVVGKVKEEQLHAFKLITEHAGIDLTIDWALPNKNYAVAVWAETKSSQIIETLHLSEPLKFSEKTQWNGKQLRRGEVLPIWRNRYTQVTGIDPDGKNDLHSGPTKNHQFDLENTFTNKEAFTIYVEINAPGDDQPSVLYGQFIEPESSNPYKLLDLVGTGLDSYTSGEINYDTSCLNTAKELVDKILVKTVWNIGLAAE